MKQNTKNSKFWKCQLSAIGPWKADISVQKKPYWSVSNFDSWKYQTQKYCQGSVAIRKPEQHVRKALHFGSKQQ